MTFVYEVFNIQHDQTLTWFLCRNTLFITLNVHEVPTLYILNTIFSIYINHILYLISEIKNDEMIFFCNA